MKMKTKPVVEVSKIEETEDGARIEITILDCFIIRGISVNHGQVKHNWKGYQPSEYTMEKTFEVISKQMERGLDELILHEYNKYKEEKK